MTRFAALRASLVFLVATLVVGTLGAATGSMLAQAAFAILAAVAALTGAMAALQPQPVPVRVRARSRIGRERL